MSDANQSSWDYINKGSKFMLLDNVSKGLEPVLVLLCARLYVGGEWGFFKYYESILLLLMRLAVIGLDRGVVWIYSKRGSDESFGRAFSRAVNFTLLLAILLSLFAAAQWLGWIPSFGRFAKASGTATGFDVACYLLALPSQAATLLFLQAFVNKQALMPVVVLRNMVQPLTIYGPAVLLAMTPLKSHGLAAPYLFGSTFGLALSIVWYFKVFRLPLRSWGFSALIPKDLLRFSLPLASTDVLMSFAYRLDILLLAKYAGIEAVEVYSVINWVANTLRGIRQSFDSILLSVFSQDKPGVYSPAQGQAFNYATFIVLAIQIPFVPLAWLFGGHLLGFIAEPYSAGGAVLAVAVLINLGSTIGSFAGLLVTGIGKTWTIVASQAVYFVFSLVLNLWMVPRWGLMGAAVATGIANVANGFTCWYGIFRLGKTWLFQGEYMRPLGLYCLCFAPNAALHLGLRAHWAVEALLFAGCLALFAWLCRRKIRHFNLNRQHRQSN
jgi:O-antigen/teichoic acid export membrane protein